MTLNLFTKPGNKQMIALIIGAIVITGGVIYYGVSQFGIIGKATSPKAETLPEIKKVTALGRLEPEMKVIQLSAPSNLDGDRVLAVMVAEGDKVSKGQIIAVLDSRDRLRDAALVAEKQVAMAKAKLAQVKAGAKTGDIRAQQAAVGRFQAQTQGDKIGQQETIARLQAQWQGDRVGQQEVIDRLAAQLVGDRDAQLATIGKLSAELKNAEAEYERYRQLSQQGAISASLFDSKGLSVETARQQLSEAKAILTRIEATGNKQISEARTVLTRIDATNSKQISEAKIALSRINATGGKQVTEAKATLSSIAEVRNVDITVAQAEIENATASWQQAKTEAEEAYIRAPMAGQILKIHSRPGEKISDDGIAEMAQNQQMLAVAEVYQSDIAKVKLGQKAIITGQAFTGEVKGTVSQIGLQVNRQNTFANQPGENMDRRVIEVKILINQEDVNRVSGLTNLQVQTAIEL
ncbi:efflux RND transporter periplasmic adaptor subunit [Calothrix sp. PCC 6303]|uniref:efflux RND transporter periplasmic adaptor subunit n=1 Tax=Calothrix sp. PCC 6303 TaxID=1170562 RepID=UPI0002A04D15|nr:efflux RND transporter periplasmic adaptor subunit [Calothrix sp. PCC 6303]AFZ02803.1 ABC exporter membrane fusion protein, DevB family [Calothrix sp. PCC 6303]